MSHALLFVHWWPATNIHWPSMPTGVTADLEVSRDPTRKGQDT